MFYKGGAGIPILIYSIYIVLYCMTLNTVLYHAISYCTIYSRTIVEAAVPSLSTQQIWQPHITTLCFTFAWQRLRWHAHLFQVDVCCIPLPLYYIDCCQVNVGSSSLSGKWVRHPTSVYYITLCYTVRYYPVQHYILFSAFRYAKLYYAILRMLCDFMFSSASMEVASPSLLQGCWLHPQSSILLHTYFQNVFQHMLIGYMWQAYTRWIGPQVNTRSHLIQASPISWIILRLPTHYNGIGIQPTTFWKTSGCQLQSRKEECSIVQWDGAAKSIELKRMETLPPPEAESRKYSMNHMVW